MTLKEAFQSIARQEGIRTRELHRRFYERIVVHDIREQDTLILKGFDRESREMVFYSNKRCRSTRVRWNPARSYQLMNALVVKADTSVPRAIVGGSLKINLHVNRLYG